MTPSLWVFFSIGVPLRKYLFIYFANELFCELFVERKCVHILIIFCILIIL